MSTPAPRPPIDPELEATRPVSWWVQAQQTGDAQAFYEAVRVRQAAKRQAAVKPIEAITGRPWPLQRVKG